MTNFYSGYAHLPPEQVQRLVTKPVATSQLGQSFVEEAIRWLPAERLQTSQSLPISEEYASFFIF